MFVHNVRFCAEFQLGSRRKSRLYFGSPFWVLCADLDARGERLPEIRNNLRATPRIADIFLRIRHFLEQAASVAPALQCKNLKHASYAAYQGSKRRQGRHRRALQLALRKRWTDAVGELTRQPPLHRNCVSPADPTKALSDAWEMDPQFNASV